MNSRTKNHTKVPKSDEINRWRAAETDEDVLLVRNWITDDEVVIAWSGEASGWTCSACGVFTVPGRATQAVVTCVHLMGGLRDLPRDTATQIGADLIKARRGKPADAKAAEPDKKAIGAARAAIARSEAKASVGRHAERDARHREISSEVVVRQMTDADRARLAGRRRRKKIEAD